MIDKPLLLHEIKNETLKEYIARYDSAYNEGEKGIVVWCEKLTFNGETKYAIGYPIPSTFPSEPMILCEPINGRKVIMTFPDVMNDVVLAADRALELSKEVLSEEDYKEFKKIITSNKKAKYEEHITVLNEKISLSLTFDKNQNLVRVDTMGFW